MYLPEIAPKSQTRKSVDCKRGRRKGGPRQKTSKSVKNIFDTFRHFSQSAKKSKIVKECQNIILLTLFDAFRAAPVFRPLLGGSGKICHNRYWSKNRRGGSGEGLGGRTKLFMLGFPPKFLKCFRDRQPA